MGGFTINEMLAMQQALQEKYKDKWEPIGPEEGKHKLVSSFSNHVASTQQTIDEKGKMRYTLLAVIHN